MGNPGLANSLSINPDYDNIFATSERPLLLDMHSLEKAHDVSSPFAVLRVVDASEEPCQRATLHHQCPRVYLMRSLGVLGEFPLIPKSVKVWRIARPNSGEEVCDVYPDFLQHLNSQYTVSKRDQSSSVCKDVLHKNEPQ